MITLRLPTRVFLCMMPTDMRKSFDSLAMLVASTMASDPLAGDLFVFKSKRGDRIKLLYWDGDGYALAMVTGTGRCISTMAHAKFKRETSHNKCP